MKRENTKKEKKKGIFKGKKEKVSETKTRIHVNNIKSERKIHHVSRRQKALTDKKTKLAVKARQTKWAPIWAVLKKYGIGKKIHPSAMTKYKRSWRRTKLHIKPRKMRKSHFG